MLIVDDQQAQLRSVQLVLKINSYEFVPLLLRSIRKARELTEAPFLVRLDSATMPSPLWCGAQRQQKTTKKQLTVKDRKQF